MRHGTWSPSVEQPIGEGLTNAGVTLRRASAGVQSLCFFPRPWADTQYDVRRRLTPIRRWSQRLNIFFVFNRPDLGARLSAASHIAARDFSLGRTERIVHSFQRHAARFRHQEKSRD